MAARGIAAGGRTRFTLKVQDGCAGRCSYCAVRLVRGHPWSLAADSAVERARAAVAALDGPQDDIERMIAEFRRRRDAFCAGLNTIPGFRCALPGGAFYAFPNIAGTGLTSREMAHRLLHEAGVACLSGSAFGEYGDGYVRFSYAASYENLMEAVRRIAEFVDRLPKPIANIFTPWAWAMAAWCGSSSCRRSRDSMLANSICGASRR